MPPVQILVRPPNVVLSVPNGDVGAAAADVQPLISYEATRHVLKNFIHTESASSAKTVPENTMHFSGLRSHLERGIESAAIESSGLRENRLADGSRVTRVTGPLGTYCVEHNAHSLDGQDSDRKGNARMRNCRK